MAKKVSYEDIQNCKSLKDFFIKDKKEKKEHLD